MESSELRWREDRKAEKPRWTDTVVVREGHNSMERVGDIGKVVEFGDTGERTVKVALRSGGYLWFKPEDLYVVN